MLQFNKEGEKMKINEELFDYFKQVGTIKRYQKNEIIYMQDDCADELCLVLKGRVRVYHIKKMVMKSITMFLIKDVFWGSLPFMKMLIVLLQFPQLMMLKLLLVIYKIFILIYHLH